MSCPKRLSNLFRRDRVWHEIDRELSFHVNERVDELKASGMPEDEARRLAGQQLGSSRLHLETTRGIDIPLWLESVAEDLRYAVRNLWKNATLSTAVVATLALGIGLNAAVFTLINGIVFRAPVDKDPESYVKILAEDPQHAGFPAPLLLSDYLALREGARSVHDMAAWQQIRASLEFNETTEVRALLVTCNYFALHTLNRAELGRLLQPGDCAEARPVLVLSHELWRDRFASDPAIVGHAIHYNGQPFTVIGVTPSPFAGTGNKIRVWIPYTARPQLGPRFAAQGEAPWVEVGARRNPGISRRAVASELTAILNGQAGRTTALRILTTDGSRINDPGAGLKTFGAVFFIIGMLLLVVLMACANVSTLLLSRAAGRHREIAVRLALGAGSGRLVRMLLTENVILAAMSGTVSLYLVYRLPEPLWNYLTNEPMGFPLTPDWRVLTYLAALTVAAGAVSGLAPAFQALNLHLAESLKGGLRWAGGAVSGSRLRSFLVTVQVALSLVLLVGAGIFIAAYGRSTTADPGYDTRHVLGVAVRMNGLRPKSWSGFHRELADSLSAIPGVEAVTFTAALPGGGWHRILIRAPGEAAQPAQVNIVSPGYFAALKIPIERGRALLETDAAPGHGPSQVVVSNQLAHQFWPGQDALGKTLQMGSGEIYEVVGVARDTAIENFGAPDGPTMYQKLAADSGPYSPMIRFAGDTAATARSVRAALQKAAPGSAVDARTMQAWVDDSMGPFWRVALLVALLGAIALAMALIGIYGVVSFAVRQRTREVGIRIALGAQKPDIFRAVLLPGLKPVAVGLLAGLPLALVASRVFDIAMRSSSWHLPSRDPLTYAAVSIILPAAAVLAMIGPALRAAACNPVDVLRDE
jgi:predicted permease